VYLLVSGPSSHGRDVAWLAPALGNGRAGLDLSGTFR
jgi:hypothetical protein